NRPIAFLWFFADASDMYIRRTKTKNLEDGIFINLKLSQSELGCMINSARKSINKQMCD
ncbi:hypothetical protein BMETH_21172894651806, partial [methanotrophic bacterial endosymbiont of Bathymodiolus sp.]